jgi:predicted TIM-barrel fold metal-dependent hydrolase
MTAAEVNPTDRILVVSSDSHAGPSLERSLRPYCPREHLDEYDRFVRDFRAGSAELGYVDRLIAQLLGSGARGAVVDPRMDPAIASKYIKMAEEAHLHTDCPGHDDPHARLRDMDADGITAELVFAGGQNSEVLPFIGFGADIGSESVSPRLRLLGEQIWNRWLADFVSVAPKRLIGVMQIPIWDVDLAVEELKAGAKAGLRAVNFPAPRSDFPAYNDPVYEPFWSSCEDMELPLVTHSGGGEPPLGLDGPGGTAIHGMESMWLSRRAIWELIFGGVFERHRKLRFTVTEQRMSWVPHALLDMDYIHRARMPTLPMKPSEYWSQNCYIAGSYMAHWEAQLRYEVGVDNLQWGTDYPHQEGTWPYTRLALRNTFHDMPHDEARKILGLNSLRAYYLNESELRPIADRIGPTFEELSKPLEPGEEPGYGSAFREPGTVDATSF